MRKKAIICDLDGVLVDCSARLRKYVNHAVHESDPLAYEQSFLEYNKTVEGDTPLREGMRLLCGVLQCMEWDKLFLLTARSEIGRGPTLGWLSQYEHAFLSSAYRNLYGTFVREDLLMRPNPELDGNGKIILGSVPALCHASYKSDWVDILEAQGYEIVLAIDDHPEICDMYQNRGIPAVRVLWPSVDCLTASGEKGGYQARHPKCDSKVDSRAEASCPPDAKC